jgi:Ser/Thr protein kinase RdoA (MazF antagonist)/NTP pyrophosphatase (non-canonical NTP hydrolase)
MSFNSLHELAVFLRGFAAERGWEPFHSPKNLAMALSVEAAELMEHFQWLTEQQSLELDANQREAVALEMADVLIYLVRMADLLDAARRKVVKISGGAAAMNALCRQAFAVFRPDEELAALAPLGSGRINGTWLAVTAAGEEYVLQRLNPAVFPDPSLVQANLCRVTEHLRANLPAESGFKVFHVFRSPEGGTAWIDSGGACWRLLSHIDGAALEAVENAEQARQIGAALGLFHQLLAALPPPALADTLPGFHNSPLYLAEYEARRKAPCQPEAADCRDFLRQRRADFFLLEEAQQRGEVTEQAVHGDPKVGNFLFSQDKQQVVSLIDLDTVKPGLLLHDLGDCLRSCCNPLGEEVANLDEIVFRQDFFAAVLTGYFSRAAGLLKPGDIRLLADSARLISLELGLRFYSDYLAGSPYFKADCPERNLFRARAQFALVRSLENQYTELTLIAADCAAPHSLRRI